MNLSKSGRVLFWGAAAFTLVMAVLPHPPRVPGDPNDKVQHIFAFVTLTLLLTHAYRALRWPRAALSLAAFGGAIELIQAIPALHRHADVVDWIADTAAVFVTLALVALVRRWRSQCPELLTFVRR